LTGRYLFNHYPPPLLDREGEINYIREATAFKDTAFLLIRDKVLKESLREAKPLFLTPLFPRGSLLISSEGVLEGR
jgi:hypothetical protein